MPIGIKRITGAAVCGLALAAAAALSPASAAERTAINTGLTSFFDGFGGLMPGCAYVQYLGNASFDSLNGSDGKKLMNADLSSTFAVGQIACTTDYKLLGGYLGWTVIGGVSGQTSDTFPANGTGVGDTNVGLSLSFPPVMNGKVPVFAHGISVSADLPTGKYDAAKAVNPGNGYYSLEAFWKATWLFAPGWEASWRINYIHNFDHHSSTNAASPIPGTSMLRNGDGMWVNFTASREIVKDFYLGVNGYWLKQFTGDKLSNGMTLDNAQESLYIGPGFHYNLDPKNMINFNAYLPVKDVNSLSDGAVVNMQYIHVF